jgi:hypothetical protein
MNDPTPSKLEQIAQYHTQYLMVRSQSSDEESARYKALCERMATLSHEDQQKVKERSAYLLSKSRSRHNPRSAWRKPLT